MIIQRIPLRPMEMVRYASSILQLPHYFIIISGSITPLYSEFPNSNGFSLCAWQYLVKEGKKRGVEEGNKGGMKGEQN